MFLKMLSCKYPFHCTLLVLLCYVSLIIYNKLFTSFNVIIGHYRLNITAPVTMSLSVDNFQFDYLYFDGFMKWPKTSAITIHFCHNLFYIQQWLSYKFSPSSISPLPCNATINHVTARHIDNIQNWLCFTHCASDTTEINRVTPNHPVRHNHIFLPWFL